jgi:hypothetical protein
VTADEIKAATLAERRYKKPKKRPQDLVRQALLIVR